MRASRSGTSWGSERWFRTKAAQSRIAGLHHRVDRRNVVLPCLALPGEHASSFRGEAVEASLPLAGLLDPSPLDPAAVFEAQQRGVERGEREGQAAARARFDQLADFVAVPRPRVDQRQDQHLGAAFFEFRTEHLEPPYM